MQDIVRLAALTKHRSAMYPVRVALAKKLKELGVMPSTPYTPLAPDEPRDVTCAVEHLVSYVEKTGDPRSVDVATPDYDSRHAQAVNRLEDIRQLAATLNVVVEEKSVPKTVVFEPKPLTAAPQPEPVPEVEPETEPETSVDASQEDSAEPTQLESPIEVPLSELALDASTRSRLETAMESLGEAAPKTVRQLAAYAKTNDPVDLPGLGQVSWRKVKEAMADLLVE